MPSLGFRVKKYIGTTNASGAIDEEVNIGGVVKKIFVDKTNSTFADTGDLDIKDARTGEFLLDIDDITTDKTVRTKAKCTDKAGSDLTDTTANIYDFVVVEDVQVVMAQGGDTKTVIIYFYISDA